MAEEDYTKLPVLEKIGHKIWKVRLDGYNTLAEQFGQLRTAEDECFLVLTADLAKGMVTDSNVVAQEKGIQAVCAFFEFGGSPALAGKFVNSGLVSALCEKGLSLSRPGTRQRSVDVLLWLVEHMGAGDGVVEQIVPFFDHRLPKLVAAAVNAVYQLVEQFGYAVSGAKPAINKLPKLFAHADKSVRAETTKLAVEIYKWLRQGLSAVLLDQLRPVQQKDLAAEFEKVTEAPAQKRLTKKQQQSQQAQAQSGSEEIPQLPEPQDVEMATDDPYDLMEPTDVLGKLPSDLHSRMSSPKWKDRVEVLEEAVAVLRKAPRLAQVDYTDLVRLLAKCFKDANIQVVQLAAQSTECLSRGLRGGFLKYQHFVLLPMIERLKEKKPAVADALGAALDAIYAGSSLADVLDDVLAGMHHKTPQIKISATHYLKRCLAGGSVPKRLHIDAIMPVLVKLIGDSQEPVRQAATEATGVLMGLTGEREIRPFLEKIDENRRSKIYAAAGAQPGTAPRPASKGISTKPAPAPARAPAKSPANSGSLATPNLAAPSNIGTAPGTASRLPTIPSKRTATSPAKKGRSLVGRQLISPAAALTPVSPENPELMETNKQLRRDLELAQLENSELRSAAQRFADAQQLWALEKAQLHTKQADLEAQLEQANEDIAVRRQLLVDKDSEITRWRNDAENYKLKIASMEQVIAMMKLNLPDLLIAEQKDKPDKHELSSKVKLLSIGAEKSVPAYDFSTESVLEEELWKKATEVTAQLKARIEKMKQRNRLSLSR